MLFLGLSMAVISICLGLMRLPDPEIRYDIRVEEIFYEGRVLKIRLKVFENETLPLAKVQLWYMEEKIVEKNLTRVEFYRNDRLTLIFPETEIRGKVTFSLHLIFVEGSSFERRMRIELNVSYRGDVYC